MRDEAEREEEGGKRGRKKKENKGRRLHDIACNTCTFTRIYSIGVLPIV